MREERDGWICKILEGLNLFYEYIVTGKMENGEQKISIFFLFKYYELFDEVFCWFLGLSAVSSGDFFTRVAPINVFE